MNLHSNNSMISGDKIDYKKYKLFKKNNFIEITLHKNSVEQCIVGRISSD